MKKFTDEEKQLKFNESRCCHQIIKGKNIGCQCQNKRKNGYEKCYLHLPMADKKAYDLARGVPQEKIDIRRCQKVGVARVSMRKRRAEKSLMNHALNDVIDMDKFIDYFKSKNQELYAKIESDVGDDFDSNPMAYALSRNIPEAYNIIEDFINGVN